MSISSKSLSQPSTYSQLNVLPETSRGRKVPTRPRKMDTLDLQDQTEAHQLITRTIDPQLSQNMTDLRQMITDYS